MDSAREVRLETARDSHVCRQYWDSMVMNRWTICRVTGSQQLNMLLLVPASSEPLMCQADVKVTDN